MKKYFYTDGTKKFGPCTIEELKAQKITRNTLMWFHPMADWKPAGEIPEMEELFGMVPPDINATQEQAAQSQNKFSNVPMPKTWLVESILATIFCCLPFGIIGIIYASQVESKYRAGDFHGAQRASKDAGLWTKVSIFIILAVLLISLILAATGVTISMFDF